MSRIDTSPRIIPISTNKRRLVVVSSTKETEKSEKCNVEPISEKKHVYLKISKHVINARIIHLNKSPFVRVYIKIWMRKIRKVFIELKFELDWRKSYAPKIRAIMESSPVSGIST
jgi:hypothetical protein